ncbi:TetR/AcrR family transcriptional regulator [Carboxylicivirga sp. N1Y90]|uniref:TetR/AcrR family transcriptional regulator n=1 Tax=Carboxylicivirga fragile TaxID=3417571 RepID=UPI003D334719|nr:TetR/AcrR family transcriptional regulator [Marinilabiliaceae bacterium N1Y90]
MTDTYPSGAQNDGMRNTIIEAARELFAKFGYKKTTMEDIAQALRKGKSSLYYYFKNKEEIFQAVIEMEEELLFSKLHKVVDSENDAKSKLREYIITRMETIHQLENYLKALKDDMLGGYEFFGRLKTKGEKEEAKLLIQILEEGTADNTFQVKNVPMAAVAFATALKGLEVPLFKSQNNFDDFKVQIENILNILFYGLIKR